MSIDEWKYTDPNTGKAWELPDLGPLYNRLRDWSLENYQKTNIGPSWFTLGVEQIGIEGMQCLTIHMLRDAHHPLDREALARCVLNCGTEEDKARPAIKPWLNEHGMVFPEFVKEIKPWALVLKNLGEL